jgi:hypothetical protein
VTWLVWRQYRWQGAIAALLLAAFATALIVTGLQMASQWHSLLSTCTNSSACGTVSLGSTAGHDLVVLSLAAPVILGFLWGAPLVAHELETGTVNFAWAQSVTKARWLTVKAGWLLLAAALWAGAAAALVTWWSGPRNAFYSSQFQPNYFDQQGIVPIGFAVFATALGIAAGTVCRRTLVAIAVTIGGFIGTRLVISQFLREHYMAAVTAHYNPLSSYSPPGSAWVLSTGVVDKYGHVFSGGSGPEVNGVPITAIPASCRSLLFLDPTTLSKAKLHQAVSCMQASGFRGFTTYQPAYHYWPFQGIETGIYLALAAGLLAVTFLVVRYRDA